MFFLIMCIMFCMIALVLGSLLIDYGSENILYMILSLLLGGMACLCMIFIREPIHLGCVLLLRCLLNVVVTSGFKL